MAIKTYSFEEGKYQFDRDTDNGLLTAARRNGVPWFAGYSANQFDKSFHAMLNRIDELEKKVEELEEETGNLSEALIYKHDPDHI